jgi:hypothetical protein
VFVLLGVFCFKGVLAQAVLDQWHNSVLVLSLRPAQTSINIPFLGTMQWQMAVVYQSLEEMVLQLWSRLQT